MAKKKATRYTSPTGTAKFVFVDKPSTKFKQQGEYSAQLVFTKAEIAELAKALKAEAAAALADALSSAKDGKQRKEREKYEIIYGVTPEQDDEGNDTGNYLLKVKRDAQFTSPKTNEVVNVTIPVFDSKKNKVEGARIGRGSRLKVAFDAIPFCADGLKKAGLSLRLAGVQLIELVEWSGSSAESMGFGDEDGFESATSEDAAPFKAEEAAADGDF